MDRPAPMTYATLFSGGEGAGLGISAAGLRHAWGLELDDDVAAVARLNGFDVQTGDVVTADPAAFEPVDALHASPPCINASVAKTGGVETPLDIAMAEAVARFIEHLQPQIFTLDSPEQTLLGAWR